jgi:hypothetical protein
MLLLYQYYAEKPFGALLRGQQGKGWAEFEKRWFYRTLELRILRANMCVVSRYIRAHILPTTKSLWKPNSCERSKWVDEEISPEDRERKCGSTRKWLASTVLVAQ